MKLFSSVAPASNSPAVLGCGDIDELDVLSMTEATQKAKMEKLNRRLQGQAPRQLQIAVKSKKDKGKFCFFFS